MFRLWRREVWQTFKVGYSCTFRAIESWAAISCTAILLWGNRGAFVRLLLGFGLHATEARLLNAASSRDGAVQNLHKHGLFCFCLKIYNVQIKNNCWCNMYEAFSWLKGLSFQMATGYYTWYSIFYLFFCIFTSFGLNIGGVNCFRGVPGHAPFKLYLFIYLFVYIFILVKLYFVLSSTCKVGW